jgi:hypothetical protein
MLTSVLCISIVIHLLALTGCPPPPPPNHLFAYSVIADPHVYGGRQSDNAIKLSDCVDWINANRDDKRIELVFIVGDIGWGSGMTTAKNILDSLTIPYIPVIGDNEIQSGDETVFHTTYAPQYSYLATVLDNWKKAPAPVWNPEIEEYSYFQNFSFDYRDIHFAGLDWNARVIDVLLGELADLHNFSGGTFPWFMDDITTCQKSFAENVIMLTHHPMHTFPAAFSTEEDERIETFTQTYGNYVYANFAGHYHISLHETRAVGQYELYITEATQFGLNNLGLVRVYNDGTAFSYHYENVILQ